MKDSGPQKPFLKPETSYWVLGTSGSRRLTGVDTRVLGHVEKMHGKLVRVYGGCLDGCSTGPDIMYGSDDSTRPFINVPGIWADSHKAYGLWFPSRSLWVYE